MKSRLERKWPSTDLVFMKQKSFLEILTEKIEVQVKAEMERSMQGHERASSDMASQAYVSKFDSFSSEFTSENDNTSTQNVGLPGWMSQIPLGKIEFQKPKSQIFGRAYPRSAPTPRLAPKPLERKKHALDELQAQAYAYFLSWKMGLKEDFTQEELKKVFRILAHKLHPDRNAGLMIHYIEMKNHYECLKKVFTPRPS